MEQYTDRNHPLYIPGTYSIYSSAVIRRLKKEQQRRRSSLLNNSSKSSSSDSHQSLQGLEPITQQPHDFGPDYNYRYNDHIPLQLIPELKTRYGVILLPQPTNSPNDPLNWSYGRKTIHFLILMLITGLTAAITNNASTPQESINNMTGISYDTLNNSAGVLFVSIGLSTWLYAPLASLCGRKISFVFGVLISIAGSIWYARMNRDGDSFGSQVFIGFGEGCSEAQVQLCLSSIFFRHQLGSVITIYVLSYSLGTYLGPLVANYISEASNFRWVGWTNTIASVFTLVMVLLFFEEDSFSYHRFKNHTTDAILNYSLAQHGIVSNEDDLTLGFYDKMWGLPKRLALITLPESRDWHSFPEFIKQYFKLLFFNLKCLWFPPVLYAGVVWGIQMALLTFYLTTEDTELYLPPFNYSSEMVALMNIPCIIGSTIGCLYSGALTDYFILWMARRRKGIVESEFRLYFAFLSGIIGSVGLFMFGFGISKALNWRVFYVGLGFIAYLFSSACNLSMLYVIDTYDQLVLETLVAVALISNVIGCIFTFACSPWLSQSGVQNTYIALAVISFALMSLAAPYLYWGKSWRKLTKKTYVSMIQARHAKNA